MKQQLALPITMATLLCIHRIVSTEKIYRYIYVLYVPVIPMLHLDLLMTPSQLR